MNTLKPLLIVAVLAGIGYGVYVRINAGNDAPPPGVAQGWDTTPQVKLPDAATPAGPPSWGSGVGPAAGGAAPPFASSHQAPTSGPAGAPPYQGGSDAPPYNPASGAPPYNAPPSDPPPYAQATPGVPPLDPAAGIPPDGAAAALPEPAANPYANAPAGNAADLAQQPSDPSADRYAPPAGGPPPAAASSPFAAAMDAARRDLDSGQFAPALRQLSSWYEDPRLSPVEKQQLNQLLDQVAGSVVYSTQHLLEAPYEVQPGERMEDIAQRYNVPWQLLAKINGIDDPQNLRPGERLKVMRGPFAAVVSLERRQLTLMLGDGSYAGRFNIGIGRDHPPAEGVYAVSDKVVNPVYRAPDRSIGGGDPNNPLGGRWIGLGSELGIHGTNHPEAIGRTDMPGSISLSPRDAEDVYDILSVGSKVIIRR